MASINERDTGSPKSRLSRQLIAESASFSRAIFQCDTKVAVMGASGGIGQPLSLLLKQSPLVSELSLYDIVNTPGVGADLSHMDTPAKVKAFMGPDQLRDSVKGAQVRFMQIKKISFEIRIRNFVFFL